MGIEYIHFVYNAGGLSYFFYDFIVAWLWILLRVCGEAPRRTLKLRSLFYQDEHLKQRNQKTTRQYYFLDSHWAQKAAKAVEESHKSQCSRTRRSLLTAAYTYRILLLGSLFCHEDAFCAPCRHSNAILFLMSRTPCGRMGAFYWGLLIFANKA